MSNKFNLTSELNSRVLDGLPSPANRPLLRDFHLRELLRSCRQDYLPPEQNSSTPEELSTASCASTVSPAVTEPTICLHCDALYECGLYEPSRCGWILFSISEHLIIIFHPFQMIAAITTYLVIFVQFMPRDGDTAVLNSTIIRT